MTAPHVHGPLFSIVTPVYDPPVEMLREAVDSVIAQTFDDWELILVDDCSPNPQVRTVLREYAVRDSRIKVVERQENGHIVKASNDALAIANGHFIALLDHDDTLAPDALGHNAAAIAAHDDVDYLYSDEDKIRDGVLTNAVRKPVWSPERLRSQNYCNHFSVLRADLVREVGGFREGFEGSQDHDLVLRVTERARRIVHIPEVLYHWRVHGTSAASNPDAKPYALEAGRRAVEEHLRRVGIDGTVEVVGPGRYRTRRRLDPRQRVSIVIPTRGSSAVVWGREVVLVTNAVRSIMAMTPHDNLEIVVVHDAVTPDEVLDDLRLLAGERLTLVRFDEVFNFSRKINLGVLSATGDWLVLLNDDVQVRNADWLPELVAPLTEPDVGMTGGRLSFSSTAVQHAGLAFVHGVYAQPYRRAPAELVARSFSTRVNREVSGVTGACLGVRRNVFLEVGGFTEALPGSYNDVDFCYKVANAGYRIVYTAHCELFHFESQTREPTPEPYEAAFVRRRWGIPQRDPYTPEFPNMPRRRRDSRRPSPAGRA